MNTKSETEIMAQSQGQELKDIDCSSLNAGEVVKNYNEMCTLLNEPIKSGKARQLQLKNWSRFFDYSKSGHKFVINEIFEEPYPSIDARKLHRGLYAHLIELLLMDYLSKQTNHTICMTKRDLYELVGMVSVNYRYYYKHQDDLCEDIQCINNEIEMNDISLFYSRVDMKLNSILTSALKSMKNRFLIEYSTQFTICIEDNDEDSTYFREATNSEVSEILAIRKDIAYSMGCETFSQVVARGQVKEFFKKMDEYVYEEYGWKFVYSTIKITHLGSDIKNQLPCMEKEILKLSNKEKMMTLNKRIVNAIHKDAEKKYIKNQDKYEEQVLTGVIDDYEEYLENKDKYDDGSWGEIPNQRPPIVPVEPYKSNYVEVQKILTDYLVGYSVTKGDK